MKRIKSFSAVFATLLVLSAFYSSPLFGQHTPSNPYKGNPSSAIDIDVTYISRTPRYDYDATKNTPAVGDVVTFSAHIRSRGTAATGNFAYKWYIDGSEVASGVANSLASGYETTFDLSYTWQEGNHVISFFADPSNAIAEKSEQNNLRTEHINALLVGFWVERSVYNFFDNNQYAYSQNYNIPDEANSWEDWAQRQIAKWNEMLATAIFPSTPQGCYDRVRLDQVIVVWDGALPLNGGLPTNHPDTSDRTVDMMWGFEKDILSTGFYTLYNVNSPFNLEPGLIHELNHARYIVDSYALNIHGKHIAVLDESGRRIYPNDDTLVRENSQAPGLMSNTIPQYAEWEAAGMNVYAGLRPLPGWANYNTHAGFGVYLGNKMPRNNYLRVLDLDGNPVAAATIEVYQANTWPWQWHWYSKYIDETVDRVGATDSNGLYDMGPNPFSQPEPIHAWNFYYCINFFKIKYGGETFYAWLDIAQVQVEYWRGNTDHAYYNVAIPVSGQQNLPPTVSAGADQTVTLPASAELSGVASDDGRPNPPGSLTISWSKVSGPGTVTFANASALQTTASFSTSGIYVLRLTASDSDLSASDDVSIVVNPDPTAGIEVTTTEKPTTYSYLGRSSSFLKQGQSFRTAGPVLSYVTVALARNGNPTENVRVSIRTNPKGSDLASGTVPASAIVSKDYLNPTWYTVSFPGGVSVTPENTYFIILSVSSSDYSNHYRVPIASGNPYVPGAWYKGTSLSVNYSYDMLLRIGFGGTGNKEPLEALIEGGSSSGLVGSSYTYSAVATDPDGDRILYFFDWGDGETTTTGLLDSGSGATASHAWQAPGSYEVKVQAVDEHGAEGAWSAPFVVTIEGGGNTPPDPPTVLSGSDTGPVGEALTFTSSARDPDGDRVSLVVDWGDETQDVTGYYPSGTTFSLTHTWQTPGTYSIRAQTVDERGAVSSWSGIKKVQMNSTGSQELVISERSTSAWYLGSAYSRRRQAQSFKAIGSSIHGVTVGLVRIGSPSQPIQVSIRSSLTGAPLASAEIQPSQIASTDYRYPTWVTVNFSPPTQVTEGASYYLVLAVASFSSANYYKVGYNSMNPYPYGMYYPDNSSTDRTDLDMACTILFGD
jgi:hypothetical protein